jgi:hypothetical protein
MKITFSNITRFILILIIVLCLLGLVLKIFIIGKIETTLSEKLPEQIRLTYKDINLNTFGQSLIINEPNIQLTDTTGNTIVGAITLNEIAFKNLGLIDYIFNNNISLNTVLLSAPTGFVHNNFSLKNDQNTTLSKEGKTIDALTLKHFIVKNANLKLVDDTQDSLKLSTINFNLKVDDISISDIATKARLLYKNYTIDSDSLFMKLGPFENIRINHIEGTDLKTVLSGVELKTKYKPEDLHRYISNERDHYNMAIDTISLAHIALDFSLDKPNVNLLTLDLINPDLKIYRDKLVADDLTYKPMISEMIRNIPLGFKIDSFNIKNAAIRYRERVQPYNSGGELFFTNSNINIQNLTNRDSISPLRINIHSYFYGKSPITAEWNFDLYNPNDNFTFKAEIDALDLNEINTFSTPNLNMKMSGEFKKLFYTISGNKNSSNIDLKVDYSDIKISVLNKTHKQRNKFYSSLANLIVSNSSETKKSKYKEAQAAVKRDQSKSNINFIVLNIKNGLAKILL